MTDTTKQTRCPWSGMHCDCNSFPWKEDGYIPDKCGEKVIPEMRIIRSIRPNVYKRK